MSKQQTSLSRKGFLKRSGASLLTLSMAAGLGGAALTGCDKDKIADAPDGIEVPDWPYNYVKLDPEAAAKRAYDGYQRRIHDDLGG